MMMRSILGSATLVLALGLAAGALAAPASRASAKLAPRVTALYQAAVAGTIETADENGEPIQKPFGPRFDDKGRVQVVIQYPAAAKPDLAALRHLNVRVQFDVAALHAMEAFVPPDQLTVVSRLDWVRSVRLPRYTIPQGNGDSSVSASDVDADAMAVMHVQQLRSAFHVSGAGVKVLVISDGVDHWQDVASKNALPETLWVDPNSSGSGDEGTVMLELVHAIAPDAALGFCSGNSGYVSHLGCFQDAANNFDADIVVDDLGFFGVDRFGYDGPVVSAYRHFLSSHPRLSIVYSAGNGQQGFFRGQYLGSTTPMTLNGITYQSVEDWGTATNASSDLYNMVRYVTDGFPVKIALQWDDPWNHPASNYDLYLVNGQDAVVASNSRGQPGHAPLEHILYDHPNPDVTLRVVVACRSGACNNEFTLHVYGLGFAYRTPDGGIGPGPGQRSVIAVGALSDPDTITNYSQHGPYIVKYPSPDIIPKPDLTAPGCGKIVSVGKFKDYFCGTSAAAPQVAGVLALLKSADVPGNRQMLYKTAVDLGPEGRDNIYGHGRVDAAAAGALMIHDEPPTVDRLDAFTVTAGESHDGTLTGTLSNAAAEAGLTLTFKVTDKPEHGTLSLDADSGAFTYAADSGYSGQDSFKFVASDGLLQSGEQTGHATVKRQSTTDPGPDPDPKPKPPTSGGGGGFGWLALLPLGFAIGLRRRYGGKTA